jgi:hypothetical protein
LTVSSSPTLAFMIIHLPRGPPNHPARAPRSLAGRGSPGLASPAQHGLETGEDEVRVGPLLAGDGQQPEMLGCQVRQGVDGIPADFG